MFQGLTPNRPHNGGDNADIHDLLRSRQGAQDVVVEGNWRATDGMGWPSVMFMAHLFVIPPSPG